MGRRVDELTAEVLDLDFALRVVREAEQALLVEDDERESPAEAATHSVTDRSRVLRVELDFGWNYADDLTRNFRDA
jgi:hypothetical protein